MALRRHTHAFRRPPPTTFAQKVQAAFQNPQRRQSRKKAACTLVSRVQAAFCHLCAVFSRFTWRCAAIPALQAAAPDHLRAKNAGCFGNTFNAPKAACTLILPPNSIRALQHGGEKAVRLVRGAVQLQIFARVQRNFLRRQNLARVQERKLRIAAQKCLNLPLVLFG